MNSKLFILAFRLLWKRKTTFFLLILQVIISSVIFIGMIGELQMIYSASDAANTFSNENAFYYLPYAFNSEQNIEIEKISTEKIDESARVGQAYDVLLSDEAGNTYSCCGYDDTLISYFDFHLLDGISFSDYDDNYLPIISAGTNYKTGEIINFTDIDGEDNISGKIIGTIANDSYVVNFSQGSNTDYSDLGQIISVSYSDFIVPVDSEKYPSININKYSDYAMKQPGELVVFDDGVNKSDVYDELCNYGSVSDIDTMKINYTDKIKNDMLINGLILLVFTILTLVGLGGINGIQSIENRRIYNIYFILGISRKKCALIEAVRNIALLLISFIAVLLIYNLTPLNLCFSVDTYKINWLTFLMTFTYISLIFIITSSGFIYRISKENIISAYKERA